MLRVALEFTERTLGTPWVPNSTLGVTGGVTKLVGDTRVSNSLAVTGVTDSTGLGVRAQQPGAVN